MNVMSTQGPIVSRWAVGAKDEPRDRGGWLNRLVSGMRHWKAVRRTRKSLSELDDNALADLGLYRDQIGLVAQRGRLPDWDENVA